MRIYILYKVWLQKVIKKATSGYYEWGEKESYPLVYFFYKGDVAFRCGEEDVTTFITNYVEVAPKS